MGMILGRAVRARCSHETPSFARRTIVRPASEVVARRIFIQMKYEGSKMVKAVVITWFT